MIHSINKSLDAYTSSKFDNLYHNNLDKCNKILTFIHNKFQLMYINDWSHYRHNGILYVKLHTKAKFKNKISNSIENTLFFVIHDLIFT